MDRLPHDDNGLRGIEEFIDARRADLIALAARLIATPSPNPPGDERAVAAVITDAIEDLGIGPVVVQGAAEERPNLLCTVAGGDGQPALLLSGHMDTKPPGDRQQWRTDPLDPVIADGHLYGLGTCDMKGALAAMIYAAAAVRQRAAALGGRLTLVFTCDEEGGSSKGAAYLAANVPLEAAACLIGEPSGIDREWEAIHLVSRGVVLCRVTAYGTQMHSSLSDRRHAVNASEMLARVLLDVRERLQLRYPPHPLCPGGPTINPGVTLHGGVAYGVVPGRAEFGMDIRCLPGMTLESVRADLDAFLRAERAAVPGLEVEVDIEPHGWVPPTEIAPTHPVVLAVQQAASRVLGVAPPLAAFPGGTDAAFFQGAAGIPTLPSCGPGLLSMAHSPNEYVPVESIVQAAKIYALASYHYLHGQSGTTG